MNRLFVILLILLCSTKICVSQNDFENDSLYLNFQNTNLSEEDRFINLEDLIWYTKNTNIEATLFYCEELEKFSLETGNLIFLNDYYNLFGIVQDDLGNLDIALEYYYKSLDYFLKQPDEHYKQARGYVNIASCFRGESKEQDRLSAYHKADSIAKVNNLFIVEVSCKVNIGLHFIQNAEFSKGYAELIQAQKIIAEHELYEYTYSVANNLGVVFENLYIINDSTTVEIAGQTFKTSDPVLNEICIDSMYFYYNRAFESNIYNGDTIVDPFTIKGLGFYYSLTGDTDRAISYYMKGFEISKKTNNVFNLVNLSQGLYKLYKDMGDSKKAFEWHVKYSDYAETLNNSQTNSEVAKIEAQYYYAFQKDKAQTHYEQNASLKTIEHQSQIDDIERKQENYNYVILAIVLFIGLAILLVFYILKSIKINKKQKELMSSQNKQLDARLISINDSISYASYYQSKVLLNDQVQVEQKTGNKIEKIAAHYVLNEKIDGIIYLGIFKSDKVGVPAAFTNFLIDDWVSEFSKQPSHDNDGLIHFLSDKIDEFKKENAGLDVTISYAFIALKLSTQTFKSFCKNMLVSFSSMIDNPQKTSNEVFNVDVLKSKDVTFTDANKEVYKLSLTKYLTT